MLCNEFPKLSQANRELIAQKKWQALSSEEHYTLELKAMYKNEKAKYRKLC
jgi:hypothetical protein